MSMRAVRAAADEGSSAFCSARDHRVNVGTAPAIRCGRSATGAGASADRSGGPNCVLARCRRDQRIALASARPCARCARRMTAPGRIRVVGAGCRSTVGSVDDPTCSDRGRRRAVLDTGAGVRASADRTRGGTRDAAGPELPRYMIGAWHEMRPRIVGDIDRRHGWNGRGRWGAERPRGVVVPVNSVGSSSLQPHRLQRPEATRGGIRCERLARPPAKQAIRERRPIGGEGRDAPRARQDAPARHECEMSPDDGGAEREHGVEAHLPLVMPRWTSSTLSVAISADAARN